jgi:hypothetical protein
MIFSFGFEIRNSTSSSSMRIGRFTEKGIPKKRNFLKNRKI